MTGDPFRYRVRTGPSDVPMYLARHGPGPAPGTIEVWKPSTGEWVPVSDPMATVRLFDFDSSDADDVAPMDVPAMQARLRAFPWRPAGRKDAT